MDSLLHIRSTSPHHPYLPSPISISYLPSSSIHPISSSTDQYTNAASGWVTLLPKLVTFRDSAFSSELWRRKMWQNSLCSLEHSIGQRQRKMINVLRVGACLPPFRFNLGTRPNCEMRLAQRFHFHVRAELPHKSVYSAHSHSKPAIRGGGLYN